MVKPRWDMSKAVEEDGPQAARHIGGTITGNTIPETRIYPTQEYLKRYISGIRIGIGQHLQQEIVEYKLHIPIRRLLKLNGTRQDLRLI